MLLDMYSGVDGPTVRIQLNTIERDRLVQKFVSLASLEGHEWTVEMEGNSAPKIQMTLLVVENHRQERLTIPQPNKILWQRTVEGWLEAAELIQALEVGTFQLLSQHSEDAAVVEVSVSN